MSKVDHLLLKNLRLFSFYFKVCNAGGGGGGGGENSPQFFKNVDKKTMMSYKWRQGLRLSSTIQLSINL